MIEVKCTFLCVSHITLHATYLNLMSRNTFPIYVLIQHKIGKDRSNLNNHIPKIKNNIHKMCKDRPKMKKCIPKMGRDRPKMNKGR